MKDAPSDKGYGLTIEVKAKSDGAVLTVLNLEYPTGAIGDYADFVDVQEALGLAIVNCLIGLGRKRIKAEK